MTIESSLDYLFHPRSIAVAGVSGDLDEPNAGQRFMQSLIEFGFKGNIYPINPSGGEIFGSKIYTSIKDVPDRVDYVVSAIPARYTPQLVADCATKGVRAIHFFTSGFAEIEDERGKQLESEIAKIARQNGIRIIGPNCMGLYCPKTGLTFAMDFREQGGFPRQSGPFGLISQSGGNSIYCIKAASTRGVYFSKVISYGNASDLNETDFLEYFTCDPDTKVIGAYIEGVEDGSRFARVLRRLSRLKPVIIFKVGNTDTGIRAAASHTSAVAGSSRIWESILKQAGAIQVDSMEEIIDVALLFLRVSPPKGRNAAVIGVGGGASVQAADECSNSGLILPALPMPIRQRLRDIYASEAGRSFRNPVDISPPAASQIKMFTDSVKLITDCDEIDLVIMHVGFDIFSLTYAKNSVMPHIESIINLRNMLNKPFAVVLHYNSTEEANHLANEVRGVLCQDGLPVYPSITRAASAFSKFIQYHQWLQESHDD